MTKPRVVLDTNVLVSAIRSNRGAAFCLLSMVDSGRFEFSLSVPLVLEYEYAMQKAAAEVGVRRQVVSDIIDYLCRIGRKVEVFYLWRPVLRDPKDEMVLELAVADSCEGIVTFNIRDFAGCEKFGLHVWTPREFLRQKGLSP